MNRIDTLAADLADHLSLITGETWSAAPHQHRTDVRTLCAAQDGAEITIEPGRERGRLALSSSFWIGGEDLYDHKPDHTSKHAITTAADRPTIDIARAIARRLLPAYRADLVAARGRKAAHDAARAEEATTAAELAAIIGGGVYGHDISCPISKRDTFHNGSGRVHIKGRVSHSYGVTLEISNLSAEAARRILAIIKDEQPVRP